jgi:hypothetical protein
MLYGYCGDSIKNGEEGCDGGQCCNSDCTVKTGVTLNSTTGCCNGSLTQCSVGQKISFDGCTCENLNLGEACGDQTDWYADSNGNCINCNLDINKCKWDDSCNKLTLYSDGSYGDCRDISRACICSQEACRGHSGTNGLACNDNATPVSEPCNSGCCRNRGDTPTTDLTCRIAAGDQFTLRLGTSGLANIGLWGNYLVKTTNNYYYVFRLNNSTGDRIILGSTDNTQRFALGTNNSLTTLCTIPGVTALMLQSAGLSGSDFDMMGSSRVIKTIADLHWGSSFYLANYANTANTFLNACGGVNVLTNGVQAGNLFTICDANGVCP